LTRVPIILSSDVTEQVNINCKDMHKYYNGRAVAASSKYTINLKEITYGF